MCVFIKCVFVSVCELRENLFAKKTVGYSLTCSKSQQPRTNVHDTIRALLWLKITCNNSHND